MASAGPGAHERLLRDLLFASQPPVGDDTLAPLAERFRELARNPPPLPPAASASAAAFVLAPFGPDGVTFAAPTAIEAVGALVGTLATCMMPIWPASRPARDLRWWLTGHPFDRKEISRAFAQIALERRAATPGQNEPPAPTADVPAWSALPERQREILFALLQMGAHDAIHAVRSRDIAKRLKAAGPSLKKPLAELVKAGLVASELGRSAKRWLTPGGKTLAEEIRENS